VISKHFVEQTWEFLRVASTHERGSLDDETISTID
jgi:hypothetical protein